MRLVLDNNVITFVSLGTGQNINMWVDTLKIFYFFYI